jgi:hypothetical protein
MAHFAQLDENNMVINIIVVHNNELLDEHGVEQESKGIDFCKTIFGSETNWKQTSWNANFRKNYACGGGTYDAGLDAFISPAPYPSWTLDTQTCKWQAPVPYPTDDKFYLWNENLLNWTEITP